MTHLKGWRGHFSLFVLCIFQNKWLSPRSMKRPFRISRAERILCAFLEIWTRIVSEFLTDLDDCCGFFVGNRLINTQIQTHSDVARKRLRQETRTVCRCRKFCTFITFYRPHGFLEFKCVHLQNKTSELSQKNWSERIALFLARFAPPCVGFREDVRLTGHDDHARPKHQQR